MQKRGQFEISFSMIFSIIIIIAIVGVGFYVLTKFLGTTKCTEIGLFYDDLKDYINEAWSSTIHEDIFIAKLPSGIDSVCFGNFTQNPESQYRREYNELSKFFINAKDRNLFLYPIQKACDSALAGIKLEHIKTNSFFCIRAENNKIEIKTSKGRFDPLVTLKR